MFFCHVDFDALGKVFHAQLSDEFVGDVAGHGIDAFHFGCRQAGNNCYDLIGNPNFADFFFFIYFMIASLFFRCHNNYLLLGDECVI